MSDIPVVYAKNTATLSFNGGQAVVHKGQHWAADDPLVAAYPDMFSTDPRWGMYFTRTPEGFDAPPADTPIETATAAPGEKRNARRS